MNDIPPAACAQVAVAGLNNDDTRQLRCGPCFDDRAFRDRPDLRAAAEERRAAILAAVFGAFTTDDIPQDVVPTAVARDAGA